MKQKILILIILVLSLSTLTVTTLAQEPPTPPTPTTYDIDLPSGGIGQIVLTMTAGEAAITAAVMVLAVISLFRVLQAATQGAKAK